MISGKFAADLRVTALTLAIGALGAAIGTWAHIPVPLLLGPACAVSIAALAQVRVGLADWLRNCCFVVLGLSIGAGLDSDAGAAIVRWPLAFVALFISLMITLFLCKWVLVRVFGFDARSAVLASAPGHLSFVMSLAADSGADIGRVAVVQAIRILALTLIVPFLALALGLRVDALGAIGSAPPMGVIQLVVMVVVGVAAGLVFRRLRLPAPLLLGPMAVSGVGHLTNVAPGTMPVELVTPAFLVLGTLIGARFAGMTLRSLRESALAGLAATVISAAVALAAALPVAAALGFPVAHVLTAFAPGGLETMIALGTALGASPGFVAACHVLRLLMLTVLIPLSHARSNRTGAAPQA
ncbi:AbrB family transcriptional regulator [Arenibacterium halophilum]|uniref:AbrB family transcriptional regulator n=1 Tax=Arenibacterium halophilum TaxID=2583821 RepID=A0ABY2XCY4_9RHOB|nr:AbrB family transcriptional regulator [Arenibacterium halophilum]TMV13582.1 AbrB family transcriptional regulator [Arenibacterium halophilum]